MKVIEIVRKSLRTVSFSVEIFCEFFFNARYNDKNEIYKSLPCKNKLILVLKHLQGICVNKKDDLKRITLNIK